MNTSYVYNFGGARGVMVIVAGNGHGNTSSNPDISSLYQQDFFRITWFF